MLAFIEIQGVSKSFAVKGGVRHVLEDVNLTVERGEFVSIVGFMGCGKSTFLNIVAGLLPADAGRVTVGGDVVRGVRNEAAYVFQNYSLLPWLSAIGNVQLAVVDGVSGVDRASGSWRTRAATSSWSVWATRSIAGPVSCRAACASASRLPARSRSEPEILFLDEPFGALDALTRGNLQQELAQLCSAVERPVTTIMITNNVEEALLLSDRIVPMTAGPRRHHGSARRRRDPEAADRRAAAARRRSASRPDPRDRVPDRIRQAGASAPAASTASRGGRGSVADLPPAASGRRRRWRSLESATDRERDVKPIRSRSS